MKAIETTARTIKSQKLEYRRDLADGAIIVAEVRHDDQCGNGHNSFAVTADLYEPGYQRGEPTLKNTVTGKNCWLTACRCQHELAARHFPELAHLLKWHLCSTDGPMHYKANALYWAGHSGWTDGKPGSPPNVEHLASTIALGALDTDPDPASVAALPKNELVAFLDIRRERLLAAFRLDVEALGFVWECQPAESEVV